MALYTFEGAPNGVYKSHTLSKHVRVASAKETVVNKFVDGDDKKYFGKKKGDTITIDRVSQLERKSSYRLEETQRMPESDFVESTRALTINAYGQKVPFTDLIEMLSPVDVPQHIEDLLSQQMAENFDIEAANAFKSTSVKYAATGVSSYSLTTNGTFGATALSNLTVAHVANMRDLLYQTYLAEKRDGVYMGIFHDHALRGIKNDPAWQAWYVNNSPDFFQNSEVGKIEGCMIVGTNNDLAFGKVGSGSVAGSGVMFGKDAVTMIEALPGEIRADVPQDLGRFQFIGWYFLGNWGTPWDNTGAAGETKIIHFGSL